MFLRSSQRNRKKDEKVVVTYGNTIYESTESIQWTNTEIPSSKPSASFINGIVSPISMDSPEFIRTLIIASISIGKSARGTLWRWNLTRSSPQQILTMLSNCRMDRSRYSPMHPTFNDTKLSELDLIDFPSLSASSSSYLNKWMAFERSGSNDLLSFIGIETAKKILEQASIANDSDELVDVSLSLQGALILGAILTTRRSEMFLSMSFSIWTLMQVAHSQMHDIGLEKKRVWTILNGLTTKCGNLCGVKQLIKFLNLSLPAKMKREDRQTLVNSLRDILLTRSEEGEVPKKYTSKRCKEHILKQVKIDEQDKEGVDEIEAPLSSPRSYDKEADSVRVMKMRGRTSVDKLEERRKLNIRSSSRMSPSIRERMYSLSPPKLQRFSPQKTPNDMDESSRDIFITPFASPSRFVNLYMKREDTSHGDGNKERKKKIGRKRRSDNWRRIREVSLGGSSKESTWNGDEPPENSRKRSVEDSCDPHVQDEMDPIRKRRRRNSMKPAGNEILGMFHELRMKTEEEWEREMEVVSRPMRAKRPVKLFDPTPMTPKKRSYSRNKMEQFDDLDVTSTQTIAEVIKSVIDQIDNSEEDECEERKETDDGDYEIENRRRRISRNDRIDMNQGITSVDREYVDRAHSKEKEVRRRTIRNKIPLWNELPIQMPPLINVNGVIQLGERTDEAVEGMIEDERRREELNENDYDDDTGIEVIRYSGPFDEHSYARIQEGDTIDEEIVDVVTVDGFIDLGENGNSFEMDEDVEEIHEIIGEDGGEEGVIPIMEENVNEVNGIDTKMEMEEYLEE